jgi:hypothetical protein
MNLRNELLKEDTSMGKIALPDIPEHKIRYTAIKRGSAGFTLIERVSR